MSGAVATSINGMPSLSSEYVVASAFASTFEAASSSRHSVSMPTLPEGVSIKPLEATKHVRWKPVVFEPSTTIFRMVKTSSAGLMLNSTDAFSAMSSASGFSGIGGSSSFSMRQVVS